MSFLEALSSPTSQLILMAISIVAGCMGAIFGLGGGLIVTPVLTLIFHVPIRYAIGASIVSVIATSSGAAAVYVKDRMSNVRLAILLEVATTTGALIGATLSTMVSSRYLYILFGAILLQSAILMLRKRQEQNLETQGHPWSFKLKLNSSYPDRALGREVPYQVANVPHGFVYMFFAGMISALLGIGSGVLKVLAMDTKMGLPIKVSSTTSNFMIGVTAAASAGAYLMRGDILPQMTAPIALGVLVGANIGTRLLPHLSSQLMRRAFVVIMLIVAIQMALKGFFPGGAA